MTKPSKREQSRERIAKIVDGVFIHGRETPNQSMNLPDGQYTIDEAITLIEAEVKQAKLELLERVGEWVVSHYWETLTDESKRVVEMLDDMKAELESEEA